MRVVFHSSDRERLESVGLCNAAHVSPKARLDIFLYQQAAVFGCEDDVVVETEVCHGTGF